MKYIVFLLMISITGYSQTIDRNNVIARQKLQYSGGNPDSNKLAVSVDANGIFKWVYFTDLQDSVNTGIYDTTTANVVVTQAIRITGATFASDTLLSIGSGGTVTKCVAVCDDIRWTTIDGTQTVLKEITDNVGIGTDNPQANLHVNGGYYQYLDLCGDTMIVNINDDGGCAPEFRVSQFSSVGGGDLISLANSFEIGREIIGSTNRMTFNINAINTKIFAVNSGGMMVDTFGNVLISGNLTATPTEKLHVEGTSLFTDSLTYDIPSAATGYVLTSLDNDGNATWQDQTAYGEMGFGDSLRTIAITQNVFSVVTNTANDLWSTAAVDLHNVTYSGDSLIVDSAGTYQVNIQLSMDGTNGSVIRLGVFLNGVLACSCTGYQELSSNRIIQLSYINIDQLNANDVLQVVVTNTANNDDVDVVGGKITINKIR